MVVRMDRLALTFETIVEELNYKGISSWLGNEKQMIERVKLLDLNQKQFENDVIYVGKGEDLHRIVAAKINAILTCGHFEAENEIYYHEKANIILVENDNLAEIFGNVQDIIYQYQKLIQVNQELMNLLLNNEDLSSVVKECYHIFHNPVAVLDASFKLLEWTNELEVEDPYWRELIENGYPSINTMVSMERDNRLLNLESSTKPIIIEPKHPKNGFRKILVRILDGKNKLGYLGILETDHIMKETDLELIYVASKILAKMLLYTDIENNKCDNDRYERIIIEILDGKLISDKQVNERLRYLKWHFYNHYYLLNIDVSEKDNDNLDAFCCYIKGSVKKLYPYFNILIYNKHILMIDGLEHQRVKPDTKYLEPLRDLLKKSGLSCGISNCFGDLTELKLYYKQSLLAIDLGKSIGEYETGLYYYYDYSLMYMVRICGMQEDLKFFCHPAIIQLHDYDQAKGTHYLETLEAYIKNYKNYYLAADAAYIHRNTMVYRINKIKEITGLSLDDNEMLDLRMSLEIYRFMKT